ncbi:MAG: DUF2177 family protein [Nanoarchaeota archaeon]
MVLDTFRNFAIAILIFIMLDGVWLGLIIKPTYSKLLNKFKLKKINLLSALIAYSFLALGIALFVIPRVITPLPAFFFGVIFGLIIYGFYNFTNFAIFDGYEFSFLAIDVLWGAIASGITSILVFLSI